MGFKERLEFKKKQTYWNRYYRYRKQGMSKMKSKRLARKGLWK